MDLISRMLKFHCQQTKRHINVYSIATRKFIEYVSMKPKLRPKGVVLTYDQTAWVRNLLQELDLDFSRPLGIIIDEEDVELTHHVLDLLWKKLKKIGKGKCT
jgi:hypothetical protein